MRAWFRIYTQSIFQYVYKVEARPVRLSYHASTPSEIQKLLRDEATHLYELVSHLHGFAFKVNLEDTIAQLDVRCPISHSGKMSRLQFFRKITAHHVRTFLAPR